MKNEEFSKLRLLRYALGGAIVGLCIADIFLYRDVTAQSLLAILGFLFFYQLARRMK